MPAARSRSTPKPWGSIAAATGYAWSSCRPAMDPRTWCRSRRTPAARPICGELLADENLLKIFHFARFDLAVLYEAFGVMPQPVYCTKIASRLARTYTDKHGLKDLVREVLGHELSKQQQSSDWGAADLTDAQISYAAADVIYLHALKERLDAMLAREDRGALAAACFRFLPDRVRLDIAGFAGEDVFAHSCGGAQAFPSAAPPEPYSQATNSRPNR